MNLFQFLVLFLTFLSTFLAAVAILLPLADRLMNDRPSPVARLRRTINLI